MRWKESIPFIKILFTKSGARILIVSKVPDLGFLRKVVKNYVKKLRN